MNVELKTWLIEKGYSEVPHREKLLDTIIHSFEFLDVIYTTSPSASNCIFFYDDRATIIWDIHFWKCYHAYLYACTSYKFDVEKRTQSIIAEMSRFISRKYSSISSIKSFTQQLYDRFCLPIDCAPMQVEFISVIIKIGKLFSLFHEIGHIYYKQNRPEMTQKKNYILNMLSAIDKDDLDASDPWTSFIWNSINQIVAGQREDILEEIVCDTFSSEETAHVFYKLEDLSQVDSAKAIVIATENLLNFQSMFNSINTAWNNHYAELKYHLHLKSYKPDKEINELAILRNQLGAMINTSLICSLFSLKAEERNHVWSERDAYSVNNKQVINCLADDDFIRQAIADGIN